MHQQYISTHDIKFPDSKQYMKPGDILLFNDTTKNLSIYRSSKLIGTVHFSSSGLAEFIRLGWVTKPTEVKKDKPKVSKRAKDPIQEAKESIESVDLSGLGQNGQLIPVEQRTVPPEEEPKAKSPRKQKQN